MRAWSRFQHSAAPTHPLMMNKMLPRVLTVIKESGTNLVLSDNSVFSDMKTVRAIPQLAEMKWIITDTLNYNQDIPWDLSQISPEDLALIQYTSGSTGTPKGVMISNQNLTHNCSLIQANGNMNSNDIGFSWLPIYHDMGLIGAMLMPLYVGFPVISMSPLEFMTKPILWLEEIAKEKVTIACGPNFAFDLC